MARASPTNIPGQKSRIGIASIATESDDEGRLDTSENVNLSELSSQNDPLEASSFNSSVTPGGVARRRRGTREIDDTHSPRYDRKTERNSSTTFCCDARRVGILERWGLVIVGVVMGIFLTAMVFLLFFKPVPSEVPRVSYDGIREMLNEQHSIFLKQRPHTWRTLLAVTKHVFASEKPEYPGTVIFAANESAQATSACLVKNIRSYFETHTYKRKTLEVSGKSLMGSDSREQKKRVDLALQSVSPFIAVTNFELLHPDSAMMFHSYCDNTNAPYKEVFYLLQVNVLDSHVTSALSQTTIEDYLRSLWKPTLSEDKIPALLSRIANNVVFIESENQDVLKEHCSS